ncbi:glycoside hydrolase family 26 protein [Gordonia terrae]
MSSDLPGAIQGLLSRRRLLVTAIGGAVVTAAACGDAPEQSVARPPRARSWGAFIPVVAPGEDTNHSPISQLSALAGAEPDYLHVYASLRDSLPVDTLDTIRLSGATPILTLEPWRPDSDPVQPEYSLAALLAGRHDADLARWASQLGAWGKDILLRFAQEMNGPWYPWSIGVNQNTSSEYREVWARMHQILREKAPNVRFVWAPNAITEGTSDFAGCYPGADKVDFLGLDGYNFGASPGHTWQSAGKLFGRSIVELERLDARLPILVTEVGCAEGETAESKARWIEDFFGVMEKSQRVEGFVWFQMDKERDWRFNSTVGSTEAFRGALRGWLG